MYYETNTYEANWGKFVQKFTVGKLVHITFTTCCNIYTGINNANFQKVWCTRRKKNNSHAYDRPADKRAMCISSTSPYVHSFSLSFFQKSCKARTDKLKVSVSIYTQLDEPMQMCSYDVAIFRTFSYSHGQYHIWTLPTRSFFKRHKNTAGGIQLNAHDTSALPVPELLSGSLGDAADDGCTAAVVAAARTGGGRVSMISPAAGGVTINCDWSPVPRHTCTWYNSRCQECQLTCTHCLVHAFCDKKALHRTINQWANVINIR